MSGPVSIIAAVATNGVIGADGRIPWHLPEDLTRFKRLTMGGTLVMGRRTWESIGRPLPSRTTVVLSRNWVTAPAGVIVAPSLAQALALASGPVWVCGGGAVYEEALPLAQHMHMTWVECAPEGDAHFPEVDWWQWQRDGARDVRPARDGKPSYSFDTYKRRGVAESFSCVIMASWYSETS